MRIYILVSGEDNHGKSNYTEKNNNTKKLMIRNSMIFTFLHHFQILSNEKSKHKNNTLKKWKSKKSSDSSEHYRNKNIFDSEENSTVESSPKNYNKSKKLFLMIMTNKFSQRKKIYLVKEINYLIN